MKPSIWIAWGGVIAMAAAGCATTYHDKLGIHESPNGDYQLVFENSADADDVRILAIRRRDRAMPVFSMTIKRDVKFVWSPDEKAVVIVDEFASNENRLIVVGLPDGKAIAEVSRANLKAWNRELDGGLYSHVYLGNLKWNGYGELHVDVDMYDRLSESSSPDCHGTLHLAIGMRP